MAQCVRPDESGLLHLDTVQIEQCQTLVLLSPQEYAAMQKSQSVNWQTAGVFWAFAFAMVVSSWVIARYGAFLFKPFKTRV